MDPKTQLSTPHLRSTANVRNVRSKLGRTLWWFACGPQLPSFRKDWYFQRKISGRARVKYCQELAEEATGHWTVNTGSKDWYIQRKISARARVKYPQELHFVTHLHNARKIHFVTDLQCMLQILYVCCSVLLRVTLKLFFGLITMSQCHNVRWRRAREGKERRTS